MWMKKEQFCCRQILKNGTVRNGNRENAGSGQRKDGAGKKENNKDEE